MAVVAGYRDLHQIHETQPLGDTDDHHLDHTVDRRRATTAAVTAARLARSRRPVTSTAIHEFPALISVQR